MVFVHLVACGGGTVLSGCAIAREIFSETNTGSVAGPGHAAGAGAAFLRAHAFRGKFLARVPADAVPRGFAGYRCARGFGLERRKNARVASERQFPLIRSLRILFAGVAWLWRWYPDPLLPLTQTLGYTWLALFFAVLLLLVLARRTSVLAAVMRVGVLREIGGVSYCIYIIHAAVFLFCHRLLLHALPVVTDVRAAAVTFLAAIVTFAIAKLSWKFLEQPLLQLGHGFHYFHRELPEIPDRPEPVPFFQKNAHNLLQVRVELRRVHGKVTPNVRNLRCDRN